MQFIRFAAYILIAGDNYPTMLSCLWKPVFVWTIGRETVVMGDKSDSGCSQGFAQPDAPSAPVYEEVWVFRLRDVARSGALLRFLFRQRGNPLPFHAGNLLRGNDLR